MESNNESRTDDEDKSTNVEKESVSATTSLLNRKGLFGNSSLRLSEPYVKEPSPESPDRNKQPEIDISTPETHAELEEDKHETSEAHNSSEGVSENNKIGSEDVTDDSSAKTVEDTEETAQEPERSTVPEAEPEAERVLEVPEVPETPSEVSSLPEKNGDETHGEDDVEEEVFVKKHISMDTDKIKEVLHSENGGENEEPNKEAESLDLNLPNSSRQEEIFEENHVENEEESENVERGGEDEEDETPKKKPKRTGRSPKESSASNSATRESRSRKSDVVNEDQEEVAEEAKTPKRGRGRRSNVEVEEKKEEPKDESVDEEMDVEELAPEVEEKAEVKKETRGRGRRSVVDAENEKDALKDKGVNEEIGDQEKRKEEVEEEAEVTTEKRGRGRRSAVQKDVTQETEVKTPRNRRSVATEKEKTDSEEVVQKTPRSGRGRRSAVEKDEKEAEPEAVEGTPRAGRGRRSAVVAEEKKDAEHIEEGKTPKRGRRSGKTEEPEDGDVGQEHQDGEESEDVVETKTVGRRGRKSKTADENHDKSVVKTPATEGRRSTRTKTPASTPQATPKQPVKTPSTTGRGRKKVVSMSEPVVIEEDEEDNKDVEEIEEAEKTPKKKRGRAAKVTPIAELKTPGYKKKKNEDEYDPYDMDTEMERHPEPLKNIHMEVQNFGTVKYAKVGSASKYEFTEKAAESRIGNLSGSTPQRKERKSLAEMAPGKEKTVRRSTGITPASARKQRSKKVEAEDEEMDVDLDADDAEKDEVDVTPSQKGRKRKSEAGSVPAVAAKKANVELPTLTSEEQWKVDHPEDEHEPHAPGARIYAIFDKVYYPAVIATERDGLGRFKVQFTADKIVKDVPSAGIIPLRVVVSGKQCFHNDDVMTVLACPNAASADEWTKGVFELESMDEDGNPNGEVLSAEWSTISLDMNDWREFINKIASQATAIVTDNITTPSQMNRARKTKLTPNVAPQPVKPKVKPVKVTSKKVAKPVGKNDVVHLTMSENGVGKNIFNGKIFMLTSANRQTPTHPSDPFRKKNLQEFIERNGGLVTEHFEDFATNSNLQPMLISDTPFRTHKYLAALARGLPCVSNKWLKACGDEGECVDFSDYLLSAGNSIFDNQPRPAPKNPSTLLSGKLIYVHSTHVTPERTQLGPGATFIDIWKPIIKLIGGDTLNVSVDDITNHEFDFLVTDNTCADHVRLHAEKIKAPLVTSEWVIQTIINSGPPPADSHQKFCPSRFYQQ